MHYPQVPIEINYFMGGLLIGLLIGFILLMIVYNIFKKRLQKCYTEIWENMMYPISMKGNPKADDILKKSFNWLKVE